MQYVFFFSFLFFLHSARLESSDVAPDASCSAGNVTALLFVNQIRDETCLLYQFPSAVKSQHQMIFILPGYIQNNGALLGGGRF